VKRLIYLATAAFVAMLLLVPPALAQDMVPGDDDPYLPEPNAVVAGSHEELERIVGRPVPSQLPGEPPSQGLPKTGGPSLSAILPVAALLLVGSGVLAYAALRRRGPEGGSVR
jgi:LPXTG-motif cell wall-anchored protein